MLSSPAFVSPPLKLSWLSFTIWASGIPSKVFDEFDSDFRDLGIGERPSRMKTYKNEKDDFFLGGVVVVTLLIDILRSGGAAANDERGPGEGSAILPRKDIDAREDISVFADED